MFAFLNFFLPLRPHLDKNMAVRFYFFDFYFYFFEKEN